MASHRLIEDQGAFEDLTDELGRVDVYGFDTEFHRERSYFPHLALLQVAWSEGVALVDPYRVDLSGLAKVLSGDGLAITHAGDQDLEVLERECGGVPSRLFDTQLAAGFLGWTSPSLQTLVESVLGRQLTKGDRLTDWTVRPLTEDQATYAAGDVVHLLDLHRELSARLVAQGRLEWAEQECELVRSADHGPRQPEKAWWRMKDARSLRGRSRGVAQAVAAWRERRAADLDKPVRFVLSDLAMSSIAHRPPADRTGLARVRGMDGRSLKPDVADSLLDAIRMGQGLSDDALFLPPSTGLDAALRPAVALASAWVGQLADEQRIDASLLATRADISSALAGTPGRLDSGWRRQLLGRPIAMLASGQAALAFDPKGELVLETRSGIALSLDD